MTALTEQLLGMGLLEVTAADLATGDVGGESQDRNTAAMGIVEAVDQMQIARSTASSAHGELPRQVGFGSRGKGGCLFVAGGNPLDIVSGTDGVSDAIEGVSGHSIDPFDPGERQRFDD
jgi:hypothetical protein